MAEKVKIVVTLDPSEAKKGAKEVIQLLAETEVAATSAGTGLKGISDIGKSGIQDLRIQKNSVEDLDARIKLLTKTRDKWADPSVVARYNRKITELTKYKRELTGTTQNLTTATEKTNDSWRIGSIAVGNLLANVYAKVASQAMQVIKTSRQLAFSVEETAAKYKIVLGPSIDVANKFIQKNQTLLALSNREAREYVAQAVQVGKSLEMQASEAAEFGTSWVKLAGDYQSFFDIPFEEAFTKIRSGLTGEWTALKQLGIAITETEVKERALLDTGYERVELLNQSQISQARFALILEKSKDALGDMSRNQDQAAAKTRQMNAEFKDIAEQMATKSIPLWNDLATSGLAVTRMLKNVLHLNVSDKFVQERIEVNALTNALIRATNQGEDRSDLIAQLNSKYPKLLENLNMESATTKDISGRLEELNKHYIRKIAIQIAMEEHSEVMRRAGAAEVKLGSLMIATEAKLNEVNEEYNLGLVVTLGTLQESIDAAKEKLKVDAEFVNTAKGNNVARNDEAKAIRALIALEHQLAGAIQGRDATAEAASSAAAYVKAIEKAMEKSDLFDPKEPIPMPIKPFIDPSVPIAEMLEESLPEVPEIEVGLKIETENLAFLYDSLASAEQQYTQAATTEERKRHQDRMESLQKEIEARKEGITVEQLLEREAHQERMAQVVEYIEQINEAYQLIAGFQGAVTDRRIQSIQHEKEAAVSSIDAQLSNTRLSERQRDKLLKEREAAEVAYQKKIDKLQREQFERERLASLAQVAANTAVAVAKVWSQTGVGGVFAQALPIAMGIIQAGTIIAQPNPYLDGGLIQERLPTGQTAPGKKLISINENNKPEFIMNALSAAKATPFLNRMNKDPDFAERINKAYTGHQRPNAPKSEIGGFSSGIDTNSLNAAVRSGIEEAMKDVRLHVNLAVSEIFDKSRIFEGNQDAVGNQA